MYYKYFKQKRDLNKFVGDISQVAGIKKIKYLEGKSAGIKAVDFWTGRGLQFTVLLDRCLDISRASFNGKSLCWRSPSKEVHPHFFENQGYGWKDGFFGGLVTTCGLTYLGAPCVDQGEALGLHGKIAYIPGENIKLFEEWQGNDYLLSVEGSMNQVSVFGECLRLTRKISTWLDKSDILIEDKVENVGHKDSPFMLLYHINIGFPLLSPKSRLIVPSLKIAAKDAEAEDGIDTFDTFQHPAKVYNEKVYYHDMKEDEKKYVNCAVISDYSDDPFGLYLTYKKKELPEFVQWKMLENQNYVLGIEPSNCWTEGRDKERMWETLDFLKPQETRTFTLKLGVLKSRNEIDNFCSVVSRTTDRKNLAIISKDEMIEIRKKRFYKRR